MRPSRFAAHEVVTLLEQTLPDRFWAAATDYQLVEEVDEVLPTLLLVVSPRVGPVDEPGLVEVVLAALARREAGRPGRVQHLAACGDATRRASRAALHAGGQDPARPRADARLVAVGCDFALMRSS